MAVTQHHTTPSSTRAHAGTLAGFLLTVATLAVGGAAAVVSPLLAVAAMMGLALMVAVWLHPPVAAFALVLLTPLTAGMDRGLVLPLVRPNEALLALVAVPILLKGALLLLAGTRRTVPIQRMDVLILLLIVTGSVMPALWMVARGVPLSQEDVLYGVALWKYYGLFLVMRASALTVEAVRRCLWLSMAAGAIVAVVAVLQSLQLLGVPGLLATYFAPNEDVAALGIGRGTSTLAQAQATGAVVTYNFAIAVGMLVRGDRPRVGLAALSALFGVGAVASGQFSSFFGFLVAIIAVGAVTGALGKVLRPILLLSPVAALALWPVIAQRLTGFGSPEGLPRSWIGRWENLQQYFWPELFDGAAFLLGVRLAARVPGREPWQNWVYIESGHTWLLWIGGVPFLVAFLLFWLGGSAELWRRARTRLDAVGSASIAAFAAMTVLGVLMVFDPHLTMRGSADLLFTLLGLACVRGGWSEGEAGSRRAPRASDVIAQHTPSPTPEGSRA